jgi:uncharacterized protein (TIGR03435 family)
MKTGFPTPRLRALRPNLINAASLMVLSVFFSLGLTMEAQSSAAGSGASGKRLEFEVASIHPSDPLNDKQSIRVSPGGRLSATITVAALIELAYGVRDFQIVGAPKWAATAKYDINAKSDDIDDPSKLSAIDEDGFNERQMQRLQSLLIDRFGLKVHRGSKRMPVYALVVAKGGAKLGRPKVGERHRLYSQAPGKLACFGASMPEFADELADLGVERIVVDKTGLTDRYDFNLRWTPEEARASEASATEGSAPSLFTALEEQLGLKLDPQKGPAEVLFIDHVEKPTVN